MMDTSNSCMVSRLSSLAFVREAFVLLFIFFRSAESFQFINKTRLEYVILEFNTAVSHSISCQTDDSNASTSLSFNFQKLQVGGRVSLDKQVYTIHNVTRKDFGMYKCEATSSQPGVRPIQQDIHFVVLQEMAPCCPNIYPRKTVTLNTGQSTTFRCHTLMKQEGGFLVLGKYLDFKWYRKNGSSYVSVSDNKTHRHNESWSLLPIKNANATPDEGVGYHCKIFYRGKLAGATHDVALVVHGFRAATIESCKVDGSSVVNESNAVNIWCEAVGYPVPSITWLHNGIQIPICKMVTDNDCAGRTYQVREHRIDKFASAKSYLTINNASYPRDHGNFTCVANNSQLKSAEKDVEISIHSLPTLEKIGNGWESANEIVCKVSRTNPLPTFKWRYQGGLCLNKNLNCQWSASKWQNNSGNFAVSPAVGVPTTVSTLTIPENTQSKFFLCEATNVMGSDDFVVRFFAGKRGEAIRMISSLEHDEGDTMKLSCVMFWKGWLITWLKDGIQLSHATDARVNISSVAGAGLTRTELIVEKLLTNDSGVYTCGANDTSGRHLNASRNITVHKVYLPRILKFTNQTVYKNTTVRWRCSISAHPSPKVAWHKDSASLKVTRVEMKESDTCENRRLFPGFYQVKNDAGELVICSPSHEEQTGFYTCEASNREGTSNTTAYLNVLEDPKVSIIPSKEASFTVKLGALWNVTCTATGNPMPFVHWRKVEKDEDVSPKRRGDQGVVLVVSSVTEADLGNYSCVAENSMAVTTKHVQLKELVPFPDLSTTGGLSKEATIALSVVGAILSLTVFLAIAFCCFIRRQQKQIAEYRSQFFPVYVGEREIDPNRTLLEQCNDLPYDPAWEFPEDKLIFGEVLGSGAFGQVIKAEAIGITDFNPRDKSPEKGRWRSKLLRRYKSITQTYHDSKGGAYTKTTVAVKTLKEGATVEDYRDLASELKILIHVGEHTNIVNLLGACIKRDSILVILEYAPHGSLVKFLRGKRDVYEAIWSTTTNDPEVQLNISNLVGYSYQISRGMEYLASKKCVHRDLAARNVLVGEDYVMKIADFGLARDIYKTDLYVKTSGGVLPIKWMAMESLFLREYSEKSDVWSFGICLWEIFTLGGTPYPTIPTEQLLDFLSDGKRMENPQNCPSEIYNIMQNCWQKEPDTRPTFGQISIAIGRILEQRASRRAASEYIKLAEDNNCDRNDYYLNPHDSDSTIPLTRADIYDRRSSGVTAHSPLPSLPRDMEHHLHLESDEEQRMLEQEFNGSLSGNESGIELEEVGSEQAATIEPNSTGKARDSKYKNTLV